MNLSHQRIRYQKQTSSALIIVLFAVVLATVIILAIMTGAQIERQTSFYYEERARADILAQGGLEHAIGLLRTGMGTNNQSWVSGPGRIWAITYNASGAPSYTPINLFSGTNTVVPTGVWAPPNLNSQKLDGTYPITSDATNNGTGVIQMQVAWIYVRKDGTLDTSDTPAVNAFNPLVGRYAFWVDNSSSRLNLNTAWTRNIANSVSASNNTNTAPMNVSRISFDAITNAITGFSFPTYETRTNAVNSTTNFFNSDYDLRTADIVNAVSSNRYNYTYYNHSSDGLNPFGQPKIYLTTQSAYVPPGATNYLNILATPTGSYQDPGIPWNLSDANIQTTVNTIASYLMNTNWPECPGKSFAQKYWGSNSDPRIFQLAVNIVEYVRAKESQQEIVGAIKGYVLGTSGNYNFSSQTVFDQYSTNWHGLPVGPNSMPIIGVTRTPLIDEFSMYWLGNNPTTAASLYLLNEIYLPPNCGIASLNISDFAMITGYEDSTNSYGNLGDRDWSATYGYNSPGYFIGVLPNFSSSVPLSATNRYGEVTSPFNPNGGRYSTGQTTVFYGWTAIALPPPNQFAMSASTPGGYSWGPVPGAGLGPITLTTTNTGPLPNSFQAVDDPLTGNNTNNWRWLPSTWGTNNSTTFTGGTAAVPGAYPGSPPQQDTDASGYISTNGWQMPYPYNFPCTNYSSSGITVTTNNTTGMVNSLAELGYVSTSSVGWDATTGFSGNGTNGVPWRTLRLQPSSPSGLTNGPPDWALLDLFAVPPPATMPTNVPYEPYVSASSTNSPWTNYGFIAGGRLNPNSPYPFTSTTPMRTAPLMALFYGATNPITGTTNSLTTAGTLATNVAQMTPSSANLGSISLKGTNYDSANGLYAHIGELAEIAGVADGGEASEANLYEPLAQTTVGGDVFTVYTVGQALRQTPSGSIVVNGEKRYQATIERNLNVPATPTATGLFRILGVRELTP